MAVFPHTPYRLYCNFIGNHFYCAGNNDVIRNGYFNFDDLYTMIVFCTCTSFCWKWIAEKQMEEFSGIVKAHIKPTIFMKFIRSFAHAWHGIQYCFRTQLNFRIHLLVLILVTALSSILGISANEWLFIIACSMLVLALELLNTAIEHLCDTVTKEIHPSIKIIKDVAAGAVLIAAAGSVITGIIIFLPKIIVFLKI